jgi:hypothetical protein
MIKQAVRSRGGGRVGHKLQRLELTRSAAFPIPSAWASDCGSTAGSTAARAGYLLIGDGYSPIRHGGSRSRAW